MGYLYNLAHFANRKLIEPLFFVQSVFCIGPDLENLFYMKAMADRLSGNDYYLFVLAARRHQLPFVTMGALLGGNVRVGLRDNLYIGKGQLASSNAEQVRQIRRILEELSLEIASPDDARHMLYTNGAGKTVF